MAAPVVPMNLEATNAQVKRLVNHQLKLVCKGAGLPVSGAKAALQQRIITHLHRYSSNGSHDSYQRLRSLIYNPTSDMNGATSASHSTHSLSSNATGAYPYHTSSDLSNHRPTTTFPQPASGAMTRGPQFRQSPFFTIVEPLTPIVECQVREANRDTVHATINLRSDIADRLNRDKLCRVMIYCASTADISPFSRVDISFPYQVEIKVNQDEVKSNLRGLKNKPGTTRPADITDLLRRRPGYNNDISVTYALTKTRYYLLANLVEQHPAETLVAKLKQGKIITKDRVLREMVSNAQDSDVVATSTILSLKCPLSTLRIEVPCRSTICSHNQCFDAMSFLQLQEQAPTWTCPICNKHVTFENLHIDQYVDGILKATPRAVDQVTIEPDGKWSIKSESKVTPATHSGRSSTDRENDLVEIQGLAPSQVSVKAEHHQPANMLRTPPIPSREPSTSSSAPLNGNSKRPAAPVVDLTFSSDEEEQPPRAPKRQQLNGPRGAISTSGNSTELSIRSPNVTNIPRPSMYPTGAYQTQQH